MRPYVRKGIANAAEAGGLADLRRRRNWIYGWIVAGIPIIYGAGTLFGDSIVALIVWGTAFVGIGAWHWYALCPRCHKPFNRNRRGSHSFTEECTRCGLELDAIGSADDE